MATGLGEHLGISPLLIRLIFAVLAAWQLVGVAAYLVLWLALPPTSRIKVAPGVDAATRTGMRTAEVAVRRGSDIGQVLACGLIAVGGLWLLQVVGWGIGWPWLVAGSLASLSAVLVWWQADRALGSAREQADGWRSWTRTVAAHWSIVVAHVIALIAATSAVAVALVQVPAIGTLGILALGIGLFLTLLALLGAPWVLRARRALMRLRDEKIISDARADMAAHLHDSVLQTLALIQRRAHDGDEVARLARAQERQLREYLYGAGGSTVAETSVRGAVRRVAAEIEDEFGVPVEIVTVGDTETTPDSAALVQALREALLNAVRHGKVGVDVYLECADDGAIEAFVRDRGPGFDLSQVPTDRLGVRESVIGRMQRAGGSATVRRAPGGGTEVGLRLPAGAG